MNGLGLRIVTALVLMPIAVVLVLWLPTDSLRLVLALIPLLGTWEWARLCGIRESSKRMALLGLSAAIVVSLGIIEARGGIFWFVATAALFWVVMTFIIGARRNRGLNVSQKSGVLVAIAGPLLMGMAWIAVVAVHRSEPDGHRLALFMLALVWVADSAAYFSGRAFGRRKLAPAISPGKTLEGVAGAVVGALVAGVIFLALQGLAVSVVGFVLLCVVVTLISVTGDLFESLVKRWHGAKDSGTLLPGHGGLLDRIDSIMAAAPVFYTGLVLLEFA